jgi:hypothetical protein
MKTNTNPLHLILIGGFTAVRHVSEAHVGR